MNKYLFLKLVRWLNGISLIVNTRGLISPLEVSNNVGSIPILTTTTISQKEENLGVCHALSWRLGIDEHLL